jgi:hypothetical protein
MDTPVQFLKKFRPGGPWVLTAIDPAKKQPIETKTVRTAKEAELFILSRNGRQNLYFSVNPTKRPMNKKAAKEDIKRAAYVHADLDPRDGETPEAAKARYLAALEEYRIMV